MKNKKIIQLIAMAAVMILCLLIGYGQAYHQFAGTESGGGAGGSSGSAASAEASGENTEQGSADMGGGGLASANTYAGASSTSTDIDASEEYVDAGGQIALVIDNSSIDDGNFNQTVYEGVKQYAYAAGVTYSYYVAENSSEAAYQSALDAALSYDGVRLVVTAGSNFDKAVGARQEDHPDTAFLMVDGIPRDQKGNALAIPSNMHCIDFEEQEAGYLAGYCTVLDGYTKLGFIGGESVSAVRQYGYGYLQGIQAAADELGVADSIEVNYWYSETFEAVDEIYSVASAWYKDGTEVIFCCGGSLYESVLTAADERGKKIIGVDINQNNISENVLTSASKGLDRAVVIALDDYFAFGKWSDELSGQLISYGAKDYCCTLPLDPWRFANVTKDEYENLFNQVKNGEVSISGDVSCDISEIPGLGIRVNVREGAAQNEVSMLSYGKNITCKIDSDDQNIAFDISFDKIPKSDDGNLYLFQVRTWESESDLSSDPVAVQALSHHICFEVPYSRTCLFSRYVPAVLADGSFVPVASGKYLTNPEALAPNQDAYPEIASKKGLLLDPNTFGTEKLTKLNIKRAVYNIPLSMIMGKSTNPDLPSFEYPYDGETYYFNTAVIAAYDNTFKYLSDSGIYTTAIILNDWNDAYPEMVHPQSREKTKNSLYYAFNTEEERGAKLMEAAALFLAERYSTGQFGMVHDWVIANEVNQQTSWNYMATSDLSYYTASFERSFRTFYNAIRSRYANANVYFSIDHDWNDNGGDNTKWFNGREFLYMFNKYALQGGNYDWSLSVHPYPSPLTRVNYWKKDYDMTENAEQVTIMNLSSLTDVMRKDSFLNPAGEVRDIAITELGFSSYSGEKLQAAAFAYCYYIIEDNPYISSFLMNRQTDALEEIQGGLALGVYNTDLTDKYISDVYANIDGDDSGKYEEFTLNILGADSLEEALSWAKP